MDNNHHKRQNVSRQNVARAYAAGNNERKGYAGPHPLCNKCRYHHVGPCTVKCNNCKRVGHQMRDLGIVGLLLLQTLRGLQLEINRVLFVMSVEDQDISGRIVLSGGIRTVETRQETRMETRLETRLESLVVLTSSLVWIGWRNTTLIVCDEKVVRIPYGNEVLIIRGDSSDGGRHLRRSEIKVGGRWRLRMCQSYGKRNFQKFFPEDLPWIKCLYKIDPEICIFNSEFVRREDISKTAFRDRLWVTTNSGLYSAYVSDLLQKQKGAMKDIDW
ncbi:hypothetical protein Tco_0810460 [Tanacetum coccineum]